MARLYWRVKVNGKWTWRATEQRPYVNEEGRKFVVVPLLEDEEDLPVCEHCGSVLAHPCDCQLYMEEEE